VVNEGGMARAIRGVGNVRFQLEFGVLLELDGVLFVSGLRVNLLLVSALEDVGYCVFDPGGYWGPPTFSKWLKTVFWPFWQFTIFSRFSLPRPF
jgi:hypothetical protein